MATRNIYLLIIFLTVATVLFCEDLEYVTIRKTMLYDNTTSTLDFSRDARFEIDAGTRVRHIERPYMVKTITRNGVDIIIGTFEYNNRKYYIDCADLVPANTVDIFAPLLISDLNGSDRRTWVPSYYTEVLQSLDRDIVLLLDSYWREKYDPYWRQDGYAQEWYVRFFNRFPCNEFMISNSVLMLSDGYGVMIKNIEKVDNGYFVTVKFARESWDEHRLDDLNWDYIRGKEFFNMILCIDGDYMDVYLDDMEHKLTTFVLVDQVFLNELRTLIENNHADLSKIKSWPRRADGSMDYPPPVGVSTAPRVVEPIELSVYDIDAENQDAEISENNTKPIAIPLWAWLAIGGAVVIVCGAVFLVKRRK